MNDKKHDDSKLTTNGVLEFIGIVAVIAVVIFGGYKIRKWVTAEDRTLSKEKTSEQTSKNSVPEPEKTDTKEQPAAITLKETRKEGSRYDCLAIGHINGDMKLIGTLEPCAQKLGTGTLTGRWTGMWTTHFTTEIERNDGVVIKERRKFKKVRCAEFLNQHPPEIIDVEYELSPEVSKAIAAVSMDAVLHGGTWEKIGGVLGLAIVKGQNVNYAPFAKLLGLDENLLRKQQRKVAMAAKVIDEIEGETVRVTLREGRPEWVKTDGTSREVVEYFEPVISLIDYSKLPNLKIAVGETKKLSKLSITEIISPELFDEILAYYTVDLDLELKRKPNKRVNVRTYAVFEGAGYLNFRALDETIDYKNDVKEASIYIDITESDNRFLHEMEILSSLESSIMRRRKKFFKVGWKGDLTLKLRYIVKKE